MRAAASSRTSPAGRPSPCRAISAGHNSARLRQVRLISAPARPQKAVSAAHVAHPSLSHRVSPDETLWDLAMRYGVTMKSIRAVNGIPQTTDVIVPGQVLVLPIQAIDKNSGSIPPWLAASSSRQADPALATETSNAAPAQEWLWSGPGSLVQHTTASELNSLMMPAEDAKPPDQDIVVIAYTPDCRHCRELEPVVHKLSQGLTHEPSLRFLAYRCSAREDKLFAKDTLGARTFPTMLTYTRDGELFRLKPKGYTTQGILRFFNDTIRVEGDEPFEMRAPSTVVQGAVLQNPVAIPPWAPGMGAAAVAGAGVLFMHRKGIFDAALMELRQRLQSPATQSQEDASAIALDAASGHLVGTENACPSTKQVMDTAGDAEDDVSDVDSDDDTSAEGTLGKEEEEGLRSKLGMSQLVAKIKSFIQIGGTSPVEKDPSGTDAVSDTSTTQRSQASDVRENEEEKGAGAGAGNSSGIISTLTNWLGSSEDTPPKSSVSATTPGSSVQEKNVDTTGENTPDISPPVNTNALPPGHSTQQAAAAAATGAVVASAARVGVSPVDATDSAVRLVGADSSTALKPSGHPSGPAFDTISRQTLNITGASSRGTGQTPSSAEEPNNMEVKDVSGGTEQRAPQPRMVRMPVGQTPDWDQIESEKVLEAWTNSGGDVHRMAAMLSGSSEPSDASFDATAGTPKDMRGALKALKKALKESTEDSLDELAVLKGPRT